MGFDALRVKNERELADMLNALDDESSMIQITGAVEIIGQETRNATGLSYRGDLEIGYVGVHKVTAQKVFTIGNDDGFALVLVGSSPWEPARVQMTLVEIATHQSRPCVRSYCANIAINQKPAEIRLYLER